MDVEASPDQPKPSEITPVPSPAELREELVELALRDLLGPAGGPEEIVETEIRSRYLIGRLAPRSTKRSSLPRDEEMDQVLTGESSTEDGEEETEHSDLPAGSIFPSSMGLSFVVNGDADAIRVTVRWGAYSRIKNPNPPPEDHKRKFAANVWKRRQVESSIDIPLVAGKIEPWSPEPTQKEVIVKGLSRRRRDQWHVTLYLVNEQPDPDTNKGTAWLFQPELIIDAPNGEAIFEKRVEANRHEVAEMKALAMRFRKRLEFAVGHNVAVQPDLLAGSYTKATRLRTVVAPMHETAVAEPPSAEGIPALAGLELDMRKLAALPDGEFGARLSPLVAAYQAWIDDLTLRVDSDPDLADHTGPANEAVANAQETLARIAAGIALLDKDSRAAEAFRFANAAMADQRVRSIHARNVRQNLPSDLVAIEAKITNHQWRVFQLAFILLNLSGATLPTHKDRNDTADLLFFPTGGGKTEAYLGLAAYVMAMRRLQGTVAGRSGKAGVAVIMRYTLRLLTLQQFQRAAALLCACELLRKQDGAKWGDEPFRVGLWVGARTTPNKTDDSYQAVSNYHNRGQAGGGTPHQLNNCPWCGRVIDPGQSIVVETYENGRCRTLVYCGDPEGECPFSQRQAPGEGLPILTVDEEIYRRLPALLIATVDKFAQMPWNGQTAALFGRVTGFCERHGYRTVDTVDSDSHNVNRRYGLPAARMLETPQLRPPDLIIQDELHLISGPLGSLVGLYETAVDDLCTWEVDGKTVKPKIVASTATIRQADQQVQRLFARYLNVFPAPGVDAEDSFFARERPVEQKAGRRYLGICAHGERHRTALIRVYVTMMSAAWTLYKKYGVDFDPWMTLVGYFNSLRELGAMRRSVDDSVRARLDQMDRLGLERRHIDENTVKELTSRLDATDIPEILDRLEQRFEGIESAPEREKRGATAKRIPPLDVLLATNMISVGVDVSRLGLMVVASQPKNTAEYIQSTSRVGRTDAGPGLVVVAYNWTRPRDLSHYETFGHYHATAYQHVEALSVTPFSKGAIDRGLSGVLTADIRLMGSELNGNAGALRFSTTHQNSQKAKKQILDRFDTAKSSSSIDIRAEIDSRLDAWAGLITRTESAKVVYKKFTGEQTPLLHRPEEGPWQTYTVLNSLRDVEPTSRLILNTGAIQSDTQPRWTFGQPTAQENREEDGDEPSDE